MPTSHPSSGLIRALGRDRSTGARTGQGLAGRRPEKSYKRQCRVLNRRRTRCPTTSYARFFRTYMRFSRPLIVGRCELINDSFARRPRRRVATCSATFSLSRSCSCSEASRARPQWLRALRRLGRSPSSCVWPCLSQRLRTASWSAGQAVTSDAGARRGTKSIGRKRLTKKGPPLRAAQLFSRGNRFRFSRSCVVSVRPQVQGPEALAKTAPSKTVPE